MTTAAVNCSHPSTIPLGDLSVKELSHLICSLSDDVVHSSDPSADEMVCQKLASYMFQEQMNGTELVGPQFNRFRFDKMMQHILESDGDHQYNYEWIWNILQRLKSNSDSNSIHNPHYRNHSQSVPAWAASSKIKVPKDGHNDDLMDLHNISPSAIDTLLDEIEENEQEHQQRIQQEKQEQQEQSSPTLDQWIRSRWKIGSFVEVYSSSSSVWCTGKITRINVDHHYAETLEIRYRVNGQSRYKNLVRNDSFNLRPLSKAMELYIYVFEAIHGTLTKIDVDHKESSFSPQCLSPVGVEEILVTPMVSDFDELSDHDNESDTPEPTGIPPSYVPQ